MRMKSTTSADRNFPRTILSSLVLFPSLGPIATYHRLEEPFDKRWRRQSRNCPVIHQLCFIDDSFGRSILDLERLIQCNLGGCRFRELFLRGLEPFCQELLPDDQSLEISCLKLGDDEHRRAINVRDKMKHYTLVSLNLYLSSSGRLPEHESSQSIH